MNTTNEIVQQLEASKKDIEQFINELNLKGTAAEERLETLKEELRMALREMKESLNHKEIITEDIAKTLRIKLTALEEQLEKPKKNAVDDLQLFIKAFKGVLKEIGSALAKDSSFSETLEKIHDRLQHYKLKFEIMRLKLSLGKMKVKYVGKEAQLQVTQKINALSKFVRESEQGATEKLRRVRTSVNKIYSYLSKLHS